MTEYEDYITKSAIAHGVDPAVALAVARSESSLLDPVQQSNLYRNGVREPSYGFFQLNVENGLGKEALAQGIDPRDPNQWKQSVDFALSNAARGGWGPWSGAKRVGIGQWQGIKGGGTTSPNATATAPGVPTPATSTGSAPAGTTLVNPTTNEVAPYKLGEALAPAVVINQQQSPFQYPVADANPFSSLGSAMAAGLDQGKAQFLSGGVNGGEVPPTPDFASAIPTAPNVDLPDVAGTEGDVSPLGSLFQVAAEGTIGKAGVPKLDQYGRPIGQPYYG